MILRPYQQHCLEEIRSAFFDKNVRSVCLQMPTGSGKTILFSEITRLAKKKGNLTWIIVPRKELMLQCSDSLAGIGVSHGLMAPGFSESKLYDVHIVSKDTLIRRLDKIKRLPNLIIIDEAHLAIDRYLSFAKEFPNAKIIGVTATPERLDGRGLSLLYDRLIIGPTIKELIEMKYLTNLKYYAPPLPEIKDLHRRGTEYDQFEIEELLERRKIYGKVIQHYSKYAYARPSIVFCRSIKLAEQTADKFCSAGFVFENIDGSMPDKKRKGLIEALKTGRIHGLTSCELITYGLDVPRVECIIMLRPTMSRTLFCQMIGRGLRPFAEKKHLIVLDHVGNLQVHGHPLQDYEWKFDGAEKQTRTREEKITLKLCPQNDYLYCDKPSCVGCPINADGRKKRYIETVDCELEEKESPVEFRNRPPNEQKDLIDRQNRAVNDYLRDKGNLEILKGAVGDLLDICKQTGRSPMWIYHLLTNAEENPYLDPSGKRITHWALLHEIARQKNYKPGWPYMQVKKMREMK